MNRRLARFLTRLYPPQWRARFGAEFQMFLELRPASAREICNVAGRAAVEHFREDWPYALLWLTWAFAGAGAAFVVTGHSLMPRVEQNVAIRAAWILLEAGALGVVLYAVLRTTPILFAIVPIRYLLAIVISVGMAVALQFLPRMLTSRPFAAELAALVSVVAGRALLGWVEGYTRPLLAVEEISWDSWKVELLRKAFSMLLHSLYSAQMGVAVVAAGRQLHQDLYFVYFIAVLPLFYSNQRPDWEAA